MTAQNFVQMTKHEMVAEIAFVADSCALQAMGAICSRLGVFAVYDSSSPADRIARARSIALTVEACTVKLADARVFVVRSPRHIEILAAFPSTTPRLQALLQDAEGIPVLLGSRSS